MLEPGWLTRVTRAQREDPELAPFLKRAASQDGQFVLRGSHAEPALYHCTTSGDRLVLPKQGGFRELVLRELHDSPIGGHFGAQKTLELVQQRVWWPHMAKCITQYVQQCPVCQRTKDRTSVTPGLL